MKSCVKYNMLKMWYFNSAGNIRCGQVDSVDRSEINYNVFNYFESKKSYFDLPQNCNSSQK